MRHPRHFAVALVLAVTVLLTSPGIPAAARYVEEHVDVPFVHDCHGLLPRHSECGGAGRHDR